MGEEDTRRQALNVARMRMLGAEVVPVTIGSRTLKDAINETFRDWVASVQTTHYCIGSVMGPHPFPMMVRDFQRVIGVEAREQIQAEAGPAARRGHRLRGRRLERDRRVPRLHRRPGRPPDRLRGRRRRGRDRPARRHDLGRVGGVIHGMRTYLLQDDDGQTLPTHSISAGLDYPGVGPEHAWLHETGRAEYRAGHR